MMEFSRAFEEIDPNIKMKILVVYNAWRGAFDTLKLFVDSVRSFKNICLITVDWNKDSWILSEPEIVSAAAIDKLALSFGVDIVLLLGSALRLDKPAPINSPTTYASYYISTLNNEINKVENFDFAHLKYTAHSYKQREGFKWLPTSANIEMFDLFSANTQRENDGKFLCLWNHSLLKADLRRKELAELKSSGLDHQCFGSLTRNKINSYEAMVRIRSCRAVLDDNRDGVVDESQYNDRFSSSCALGVPVIAHRCPDLDACFTSYLNLGGCSSFAERLRSITQEEMEHQAEQNHREVREKHRNEFRWAEIIRDHLKRTNKE